MSTATAQLPSPALHCALPIAETASYVMAPLLVGLPSPQLMVAVKSAVWSPGLASLKVATVTVPVEAPSVALMGAPGVARSEERRVGAGRRALGGEPPSSTMLTDTAKLPSSALVWPSGRV